jgi:hypothetical protein
LSHASRSPSQEREPLCRFELGWHPRLSSDIRLIVHQSDASLLLCYVGHHDDAYGWAKRRKLETHPTTGAAQLVEIRETVKEIVVPVYVQSEPTAAANETAKRKPIFAEISDDELLGFGVGCRSADGCGKVCLGGHPIHHAGGGDSRCAHSGIPRSIVQDLFGVARFLDQGSARKFASSSQGAAADHRGRASH